MLYLFLTFVVLLLMVTGTRGLTLLFGLGINIVSVIALLILIADGFNVLITTGIIAMVILVVAIYMNVDNANTANTAFKTSLIIMLVILLITIPLEFWASAQGMGIENQDELEGFSLAAGLSYPELAISIIVINSLGVISETSVAITSGLNEIVENKPTLTPQEIFDDGFSVGNKILNTQTNTLLFNFFATTFPLFFVIHSLGYKFSEILNDKLVVSEVLTTLICTIGVILTVPITSYLVYRKANKKI
ncbi:membrane protein [Companilactobacillus crustorum]|uniref:Integral membrane protein n=3 Tax=Companilactobacillus TaxID=2767879 RepID=A0A837RJ64_9LACO|nr:YibE/F family protein [Companilactobacillus crustorum]KRK42855.1 integral membrane protein [Companilactobacillus crustorum JCM 15951]KRO20545.1 integral membrane protein [Companilactobacillus crustorum]WDT65366.1 YibE/F family protein [Companilactobacillus crustorum]GEO76760.1 membrane protein [Companilactobacillus crustorum]